jgi:predicted flap endonuclease-1-like 5' DNA nuclease
MTDEQKREYRRRNRLMSALHKLGFLSVQEIAALMDKDADYTSINGVGPVLAKTMREWLAEQEDAIRDTN